MERSIKVLLRIDGRFLRKSPLKLILSHLIIFTNREKNCSHISFQDLLSNDTRDPRAPGSTRLLLHSGKIRKIKGDNSKENTGVYKAVV